MIGLIWASAIFIIFIFLTAEDAAIRVRRVPRRLSESRQRTQR
jgi:hypothetical protein